MCHEDRTLPASMLAAGELNRLRAGPHRRSLRYSTRVAQLFGPDDMQETTSRMAVADLAILQDRELSFDAGLAPVRPAFLGVLEAV